MRRRLQNSAHATLPTHPAHSPRRFTQLFLYPLYPLDIDDLQAVKNDKILDIAYLQAVQNDKIPDIDDLQAV